MSDDTFPLTVSLPVPCGETTFPNAQDLFAFIEKEAAFWHWLSAMGPNALPHGAQEQIRPFIGLAALRAKVEQELKAGNGNSIKGIVEEVFNGCPLSTSSRGVLTEQLRYGATPLVAANFLATTKASGLYGEGSNPQIEGSAIAAMFAVGAFPAIKQEAFDTATADAVARLEHWKQQYAVDLAEKQKTFADYKAKAEEKLLNIEGSMADMAAQYLEIKTLKEPATYWTEKRDKHLIWAWSFGVTTLLVAAIGGGIVIAASIANRDSVTATTSPWQLLSYSFPVLVGFTGLFGLLRVMVRITMSHYHLGSDAAERVVLAKTYLVLRMKHQGIG
jgi:hypothetical protein